MVQTNFHVVVILNVSDVDIWMSSCYFELQIKQISDYQKCFWLALILLAN